jgi:DNA-directed RNA polymerase specialized sigma subunit
MTLKEIGLVLGLVESRVSQIRSAAIQVLRTQIVDDVRFEQV